ncbi:MAG: hypothetical protein M0T74_15490, partial [Desulfitobacterium hafniense]|nr:hypothetical protein [Desulfitobacterium hafniense]
MNKRKVIYNGKEFESLKELAEQYGLSPKLLTGRLSEGWTLEKAIKTELGEVITNATPVTYQNVKYKSIKHMADTMNLPYWSLAYYLSKIKDIDNAVEQCRLNSSKAPLILWGNQYDSLVEISMAFGVRYSSLVKELGDNKSLQEAVQYLLSVEPIEFEGRQYATITELCMDYKVQPVNVYKRLKQGMQLDQALRQPLRITSKGDRITYEGVMYQSKTALCREYGISVMCVNQNARLNKSSFIETFQLLHQLKEHAGMTKAGQLNFIPRCIIRGTLYKTNNVLANELGISPELIKAYKRHHGFTNLFDSLKAMQAEKKAVCQLSTEVVTWEELKRRGYTKSLIDGLKSSHQILVPMYSQLQGKDFDTDCIDTLELYDQLRERLQTQLDEQDVERIAKEAEDVETEYILDKLWDAQEPQDHKGQIIISDCIAGLTQCAAELARGDPGGSADKVLRLRQHVAAIIDRLGMKNTYLGNFDAKVETAKQADELLAATLQQQLAAVHELYHYGMEMVTAQGRALKNSIKEIR